MKKTQSHRDDSTDSGNVVGIDPHKRTLSAEVLDERGGRLGSAHFPVSRAGHTALEEWALGFGPVMRWGVEGAAGVGHHTAAFLAAEGHDVRDVCPNRTAERGRHRQQGKSDALDAERIARETLAYPDLPAAFKRASGDRGPDETNELMSLWHKARRSAVKGAQHLLNEAEALLLHLPEAITATLPDTTDVRARLDALGRRVKDDDDAHGPAAALRLRLLDEHAAAVRALAARERDAARELARLVAHSGSTLDELCGIATRSAAELLVQVGDPRRFTDAGFANFNGTAPLPASSGEGPDEPARHRLNRGGNRQVNAVLHRMAVTQLRCDPRAQKIYDDARKRGHTKKEAMRVLKRNLSNVVHRRMIADLKARQAAPSQRAAA